MPTEPLGTLTPSVTLEAALGASAPGSNRRVAAEPFGTLPLPDGPAVLGAFLRRMPSPVPTLHSPGTNVCSSESPLPCADILGNPNSQVQDGMIGTDPQYEYEMGHWLLDDFGKPGMSRLHA